MPRHACLALLPLLALCAASASAQSAAVTSSAVPSTAADQSEGATEMPFAGETLATAELSAIAGRTDTAQIIRAQNNATISNNSVSGQSQTGTISFDAGAFQSMAGLSLLSANTGNNVAINSSLNVNVAISR